MEESVALDTSKQKQFVKSIKGIKKLIKKKDKEPGSLLRINKGVYTKKLKNRGLVYLSHIPHGFYENEMTQYFKQFGVVTNARVIRSKRTGYSKGFAFVEFKDTSVAEIVADTMNNYLMGKRLIKATYIPPEKQRPNAMRKNWNSTFNPTSEYRMKMKNEYNKDKDEKGNLQKARKIVSNLLKTKKRLSEMGINYDFFTPVDVPEELIDRVAVKHKLEDNKDDVKVEEVPSKKAKKAKKVKEEVKVEVKKPKTEDKKKTKGIDKKEVAINQKQKQKDLKAKGVKPLEEFVNVNEDDEGSVSSADFDSDEYENMLKQDDEFDSNVSDDDDSNEDSDELDGDESEAESVIDIPVPKKKVKSAQKGQGPPPKQNKKKSSKSEVTKKLPEQKRIGTQKPSVAVKKPNFEKQVKQKPRNKQFKKKK